MSPCCSVVDPVAPSVWPSPQLFFVFLFQIWIGWPAATDPDFFVFFLFVPDLDPVFLEKERESFPVCIGIGTHIVETNTNILLLWAFGVGLSRVITGASECKSNLYLRRNQYKRKEKEKEKTSFFIYGTKIWSKRIWTEYSASPDLELSLAKTKKELRQAPTATEVTTSKLWIILNIICFTLCLAISLTLVSVELWHENPTGKPNIKRDFFLTHEKSRERFHRRNCYKRAVGRHESCSPAWVMLTNMNHASQHRAPQACRLYVGINILFCGKDMSHACQHDSCLPAWVMLANIQKGAPRYR